MRIDLYRPDIVPVATPAAEGTAVPAQRVLDFAVETGAAVAMNTAFFRPFHSNSPFDYYPRPGEPTEPFGITMTDGEEFGANRYHRGTVYLSDDAVSLVFSVGDAPSARVSRGVPVAFRHSNGHTRRRGDAL